MKEYVLNIGDVATSKVPARYTCFGLGSCVGLFLQDRMTGVSGGAHILLPDSKCTMERGMKSLYAHGALEEVLTQMKSRGSDGTALRAKITGGAHVTSLTTMRGLENTEAVVKLLQEHKIFIASMDLGGPFSRTVVFDSGTGCLTVRLPEINQYRIY